MQREGMDLTSFSSAKKIREMKCSASFFLCKKKKNRQITELIRSNKATLALKSIYRKTSNLPSHCYVLLKLISRKKIQICSTVRNVIELT